MAFLVENQGGYRSAPIDIPTASKPSLIKLSSSEEALAHGSHTPTERRLSPERVNEALAHTQEVGFNPVHRKRSPARSPARPLRTREQKAENRDTRILPKGPLSWRKQPSATEGINQGVLEQRKLKVERPPSPLLTRATEALEKLKLVGQAKAPLKKEESDQTAPEAVRGQQEPCVAAPELVDEDEWQTPPQTAGEFLGEDEEGPKPEDLRNPVEGLDWEEIMAADEAEERRLQEREKEKAKNPSPAEELMAADEAEERRLQEREKEKAKNPSPAKGIKTSRKEGDWDDKLYSQPPKPQLKLGTSRKIGKRHCNSQRLDPVGQRVAIFGAYALSETAEFAQRIVTDCEAGHCGEKLSLHCFNLETVDQFRKGNRKERAVYDLFSQNRDRIEGLKIRKGCCLQEINITYETKSQDLMAVTKPSDLKLPAISTTVFFHPYTLRKAAFYEDYKKVNRDCASFLVRLVERYFFLSSFILHPQGSCVFLWNTEHQVEEFRAQLTAAKVKEIAKKYFNYMDSFSAYSFEQGCTIYEHLKDMCALEASDELRISFKQTDTFFIFRMTPFSQDVDKLTHLFMRTKK